MKKSFVLLSALVVTTTFIVNCQKAPDKRRVRPTTGSGTQSDVVEKAKLPTKVCSAELLNNYKSFHKSQDLLRKTVITAASTEAEKESQKKLGVETLAKCDDLIKQLQGEDNQGCYLDNGVKDVSNALMAPSMQNLCNSLGKKLKTEVELDSSYADAAKENEKAKEDAKKVQTDFIGSDKTFKISEQVLNMMYEGNTNLGLFLTEGEVKSSQTSLETALSASKTVCTAIGDGISKDQTLKETVLKFTSFESADKSNIDELAIEFKGKATMINLVLHSEGEITTAGNLLCLNLEVAKLSVAKLSEVFGKAIVSAPVQVATEVTGATSPTASTSVTATASVTATVSAPATAFTANDLAAKQPAGSPQAQNLASGTAQMIADANKVVPQKEAEQKAAAEKAAAEKKAQEEKDAKAAAEQKAQEEKAEAAKVSVVTAQTVSPVTTVAAKEQAEDAAGQLAMLKEKAERLEAEALAAEADVKKLEAEKAKAEDVDQAKAKARITRESANSANAEYTEAQKAAAAVAAK